MKLPLRGSCEDNHRKANAYKEHLTTIGDLLNDASRKAVAAAKRAVK